VFVMFGFMLKLTVFRPQLIVTQLSSEIRKLLCS
jgi:hypothetical protein